MAHGRRQTIHLWFVKCNIAILLRIMYSKDNTPGANIDLIISQLRLAAVLANCTL
jgi:hypothetical protein